MISKSMTRRGSSYRQNKKMKNVPVSVSIRSVVPIYKADPILNMSVRYQFNSTSRVNVTRANVLNTFIMNAASSTGNFRMCASVRVNRIRITTAASASLEWLSAYGPTSATILTGTSATAAGFLIQRPPKNSLAGEWSIGGSNESEILLQVGGVTNDYLDVDFSFVLLDQEGGTSVATTAAGTAGRIYRTFLDGPNVSALLQPVYSLILN